jgi:ribosome-binding factor A
MENVRLSKIERLIQKELSEIFRRQTQITKGILVTVTTVRVSADLGVARVYLSIFPSEQGKAMLESIRQSARTIRYELAQQVRLQLRKIPELSFFIDDSLDYLDNIDKLLNP